MNTEKKTLENNAAMPYDAVLGTVKSLRKKLLKAIELDKEVKHQLQYVDYKDNEWTLPIQLLDYRIDNFVRDHSLKRVKLIFSNGTKLLLDA